MMQTAEQKAPARNRPEPRWVALGKLMVIGTLLAPPAMLAFPELNHRSGHASIGRQGSSSERALTRDHPLIPEPFGRSDR